MTFAEFKAWLEGYSESLGEAPTADQWARIQEQMARVYLVTNVPTVWPTYPVTLRDPPSWNPNMFTVTSDTVAYATS